MTSRTAVLFPPGTDRATDRPIVLYNLEEVPFAAITRGWKGLDAPPFIVSTDRSTGVPGGYVSQVEVDIRTVSLPVFINAPSEAQMRRFRAGLIHALDPRRGDSTLILGNQIGTIDGNERRLAVRYRSGLEGSGTEQAPRWWQFTLELLCCDPFWYSVDPVYASWKPAATRPRFPMTFPIRFSSSGMTPDVPLTVGGNDESWPVWRMGGFRWLRVTNDRTGVWWRVDRPTPEQAVDVTELVTRPGFRQHRTVPGDVNAYDQLSGQPFSLELGDTVTVAVVGQNADTFLELTMDEAWLPAP